MTVANMIAQSIKSNGTPVVINPDSSDPIETSGILSSESVDGTAGNATVRGQNIILTMAAADAEGIKKGTLLTVQGKRFKVKARAGNALTVPRLTLAFVDD